MTAPPSQKMFYGWWIVFAAFLNLFFAVGIIFYGFPVFYTAFVDSLGFSRAQITQGFLLGFLIVGLPSGLLAGAIIDRIGARGVILAGVACIGASLILMGHMTRFWQYELLCILEVLGYVLAGPISNQVLVSRWFDARRGSAMGIAYFGLGLGGTAAPLLVNCLMRSFGWRTAIEIVGLLVLAVLLPAGIWITRSGPEDMGLLPDGSATPAVSAAASPAAGVRQALRSRNFWLILAGSTLVIGAIGAVIQHLVLLLRDHGYSATAASRFFSFLLAAGLGGRLLVGYLADQFKKKNTMALFYLTLGCSILLLHLAHQTLAVWCFVLIFGFSMGADYMLIPLVTAECFGVRSLGKLLAIIIMADSLGQWGAPFLAGRLYDQQHSYGAAMRIMAIAAIIGSFAIYAISVPRAENRV